ncbi:MAG: hypothetical protein KME30_09910 [Iphinoe sp. HA4291-MV1]|nr:hypothetical protein [Iphinoe sp. HA4291-MV1]
MGVLNHLLVDNGQWAMGKGQWVKTTPLLIEGGLKSLCAESFLKLPLGVLLKAYRTF